MTEAAFLTRVALSNYRSIKACSVLLGPLTFLVGPNGAGKSNFLDALRLITESLNTSLEHALRERGGINEVRRRSSGHPTHFAVRLEFRLSATKRGIYAFKVGAQRAPGFEVQQEICRIFEDGALGEHYYRVEAGTLQDASFKMGASVMPDRLYLVAASGMPEFRPIYDTLSHMGFYNLNPDAIRTPQPPDPGEVLKRDGSNIASVLSVMSKENSEAHDRVVRFLSKVVPGISGVVRKQVGSRETLEFLQKVGKNRDPWHFDAENMSDGTLRALGVLTALFQSANGGGRKVPFVGIEEPEVAVHPGAAGILRDGLKTASLSTQVMVTSHSPDLLDDKDLTASNLLAVENKNGETRIAPVDEAGRTAIKDRLYTAGELLRMDGLHQDESALASISQPQMGLFSDTMDS